MGTRPTGRSPCSSSRPERVFSHGPRRCLRATRSTGPPSGCECSRARSWPSRPRIRAPPSSGSPSGSTGCRLERVEAVGKNLLLGFEGGLTLRSHLRMRGRWRVEAAGTEPRGTPWLVLRGTHAAGRALERPGARAHARPAARGRPARARRAWPTHRTSTAWSRASGSADQAREVGEALLDQRLVAGIGNMWKAEALFAAETSPWRRSRSSTTTTLRRVLGDGGAPDAGRPRDSARSTAAPVARASGAAPGSARHPQGDDARIAYWCPGCQAGTSPAGA